MYIYILSFALIDFSMDIYISCFDISQNELREVGLQKSNLAARLADAAAERQV